MSWEDISIVPPEGWYYIQPETRFRFEGNNLEHLTGRVRDHRIANGLPLENIREEVLTWTRIRLAGD